MDNELKQYLEAKFGQIDVKFAQGEAEHATTETRLLAETHRAEERLTERMRDMQTELLRGFEAYSSGQTIRLRKLEADHSNLDTSVTGRMDVLETRLRQIEQRLGLAS